MAKTARNALANVRRTGKALQRRRKSRWLDGEPVDPGVDVRLAALAEHVRAGQHYECAWQVFPFGQLKGLNHEDAVRALGAWARRQNILIKFDLRRVRGVEVVVLAIEVKQN